MTEAKYVDSGGRVYDFQNDKVRITKATLHECSWRQGPQDFKRGPITYDITLTIRGTTEERANFLNRLRDSIDEDVKKNKAGKIYVDGSYAKGFFIESKSGSSEIKSCWSEIELKLYCKEAVWITEQKHEFKKEVEGKGGVYLDFPFDFSFDLTGDEKGIGNVQLEHYAACDFILTIYGPCLNPRIVIESNLYEVKTKLDEGEYLIIDSGAGTVIRVKANGAKVNEFDNRATNPNSPFEKIQPGYNLVSWDGSFGFDLMLYIERSEPKWVQKR